MQRAHAFFFWLNIQKLSNLGEVDNLAYISSAGLRVILSAQIIMNRQGNMVVCNVNEDMMEVFEVTGGKFRYFCPPVRSSC